MRRTALDAIITGHTSALGFALFVVLATVAVVVLLRLYRRRRAYVPVHRSPPLAAATTEEAKQQIAAVPVRRGNRGEIEVLVISTRGSGRWTVPKGWPMNGRSDAEAAAQEAYEEAGVRGTVMTQPIGTFAYAKRRNERQTLLVTVYRLDVTHQVRRWRERGRRKLRWLPAPDAADCVAWRGLADIIRSLEATRAG